MRARPFRMAPLVLGTALLLAGISPAQGRETIAPAQATSSPVKLRLALQDAAISHIFWVRNFVLMTKFDELKGAKTAEERVVESDRRLADSLVPYYGRDAADRLFALLQDRNRVIREYTTATLKMNGFAQKTAADRLRVNADRIAAFLSSVNPGNWTRDTIGRVLILIGADQLAEMDFIGRLDFNGEARIWSSLKEKVRDLADMLADGIVNQFPDRF